MAKKNKPLFWITGNYYECQKCWKSFCSQFEDPNIVVLECGRNADDTPPDERFASAGTIIKLLKRQDIFDKRHRIIKLKGIPEDYSLLTDYLYLIRKANALVIDGPIGLRAKGVSQKFVSVKTSKFYKAVKAQGQVKEYNMEGKNASQSATWAREVAKELGRSLDVEAARLLVEMKGINYDALYGALGVMFDYQPKGAIKSKVVEELFTPLFQQTVWDLVRAIDRRDFISSMTHLQRFYDQIDVLIDSSFTGEIMMLLGALTHHFTFMIMARDGCDGHITYKSVAAAVNAGKGMKKPKNPKDEDKKKGIWKEPFVDIFTPGAIKMNLGSPALKWPASRLYNAYRDISRCKLLLRKTYNYDNRPGIKMCIDTLIMTLCGTIKVDDAAMIRESGEEVGVI